MTVFRFDNMCRLRVRLSVGVWERVIAGSLSCVDVLRVSALVATDGKKCSLSRGVHMCVACMQVQ